MDSQLKSLLGQKVLVCWPLSSPPGMDMGILHYEDFYFIDNGKEANFDWDNVDSIAYVSAIGKGQSGLVAVIILKKN